MHYKNRLPSANGVCHGGVAIILKNNSSKGITYPFNHPENYEALPLPLQINLDSITRKIVIIAAYIPPNYTTARGKVSLQHICDLVLDIKRKISGAYILIAGDFNQWEIGDALLDYPELVEVPTPPTRGDRHIDKIFTNWHEHIHESGVLPPLETEGPPDTVTRSDHEIQYMC